MKNNFRLDRIEFENYKNYSNKQIFDLRTNKSFQNDSTTERVTWSNSKVGKYKKIIGLWGKNASGKTSLIEIVELWCELFKFKNNSDTLGRQWNDFNSHAYLQSKYSKMFNSNEFKSYSYFNEPDKQLLISMYFTNDDYNFKYSFIAEYVVQKDVQTNTLIRVDDELSLRKNGSKEPYELFWRGRTHPYSFFDLITIFEYWNNSEEINSTTLGSNAIQLINFISTNKVDSEFSEFFGDKGKRDKIINLFKDLVEFRNSIEILDETTKPSDDRILKRALDSEMSVTDSVNQSLTFLYKTKNKSRDFIDELLLNLIRCVDSNISGIDINYIDNPVINKRVIRIAAIFKTIITKKGVKNFPEELSMGTMNFINLMLKMLVKKLTEPEDTLSYFFVDELGLNWHTNLTKKFLEDISKGILGDGMFLIFTSHDAIIGDDLPTDALYVIDNENNIQRISELDKEGNSVRRKNEKFSYNYHNEALDPYFTTPNFDNFDSIGKFYKDGK